MYLEAISPKIPDVHLFTDYYTVWGVFNKSETFVMHKNFNSSSCLLYLDNEDFPVLVTRENQISFEELLTVELETKNFQIKGNNKNSDIEIHVKMKFR